MKLQLKDYIAIAVVTVVSFPILYIVMLFITGYAHIEFGPSKEEKDEKEQIQQIKQSARKDSLAAVYSKTFQALQQERSELEREKARLSEQRERLNFLQAEIEAQQKKLMEEREKIESLVSKSDSLNDKKIKDLAKMYAAMRPSEAASILGTMEEKLAARIIRSINDDRQKAKILGSFPNDKAARISKIIGGQ